ncbi:hypothetical protein F2P79_011818 [Pimephales promelas]|nr:hypothetical protein F2P79_011818 [Pimephales promelas]
MNQTESIDSLQNLTTEVLIHLRVNLIRVLSAEGHLRCEVPVFLLSNPQLQLFVRLSVTRRTTAFLKSSEHFTGYIELQEEVTGTTLQCN